MQLTLERKYKGDTYTIGKLYVNGILFSDTLEDKDRELSNSMSVDEIKKKKVYGRTAIPSGTYRLTMTYSGKFANRAWGRKYKGLVPEILNVKGFKGVRIHPLNKAEDSLGCIGVGKNDRKGWISNATDYYYRLLDNYIMPATHRKEPITLTIQ